jgi:hypothetical protein
MLWYQLDFSGLKIKYFGVNLIGSQKFDDRKRKKIVFKSTLSFTLCEVKLKIENLMPGCMKTVQ